MFSLYSIVDNFFKIFNGSTKQENISDLKCQITGYINPESDILMHDNIYKKVKDIIPGDLIQNYDRFYYDRVLYVLRIACSEQSTRLDNRQKIKTTEHHPINVDGKWKFPVDTSNIITEKDDPHFCTFICFEKRNIYDN